MSCPGCAMQLDGHFELPALVQLSREELAFVLDFVRSAGSLKEMGRLHKVSYPTVRNRLNEIIAKLTPSAEETREHRRKAILDALAAGELSVAQATEQLKELGS
ncbi:MAG: DUF2089 family protein [Deltaproteobacteria bacterium]|nr:DUF2089 family protein [Deltaproteobacteria bacterium]